MLCTMGSIPASAIRPGGVAPTQTDLPLSRLDSFSSLEFSRSKSNGTNDNISGPLTGQRDEALVLKNKAPRWHDQLQCWCLNFHGRVTVASVKNFQLVASPENGPPGPPDSLMDHLLQIDQGASSCQHMYICCCRHSSVVFSKPRKPDNVQEQGEVVSVVKFDAANRV